MIKRLLSVHKDIFGVVIIVLCLIGVKEMSAQGLEIQDLFVGGENGYHTYRIPSIIVTPSGAVLAFCEGRKNGGGDAGKIDLLMKRSEDGGKTWTEQTIVWDDGINTCGNPCPVVDEETGTIWMFLTWNLGGDHEKQIHLGTSTDTRRVFLTSSTDDGKTWVKPVDLTNELKPSTWRWYATGPGVGIQVKNGQYKGRMVIPCDYSEVESD
ncbi:MAG: sialidase family protein, partial [Elusimicrobiota bacterium]